MTPLPLQQILSASPISVAPAAPISDVLTIMEQRHISCILAVDTENRPVGIFTEQDAVTLMANNLDMNSVTMAKVMHQPVFTAPADMDYRDAYRQMLARNYRHLAVVDAVGALVGVITRHDIVKALQDRHIEYLHETIQRQRLDLTRIQAQDAQLQLQAHALNAAGNAIVITDVEPRILWANAAYSALTGFSLEEVIGRKPAELVSSGKQDAAFYQQMWQTILAGQVWHGELVNKRKDGSLYDEELTITPVRLAATESAGHNAEISHFIAVKQDISERKAVERNLRASEAHFRLFYEHAPVAYQSLDASGHIQEVNTEWLRQFGYPREQVIGRFIGDFLVPGQEALQKERFADFLRDGAIRKTEYDFLHRDGNTVTVAIDGLVDRDEQGSFKRTQCVLHNITARKKVEQELRHIAATDALTGLANRRHFLEQMQLALARHQRHAIPTALLMLDLDWFKQVNDRYGHAVGDEVLQHFAHITEAGLRRIDLIGRLGGEEFAILLPDTEADGAFEFAERLCELAAQNPAHTQAGDISVTVSIGVTPFSPHDLNTDVILARADLALYRAKANGRNRVEQEPATA